MSSAIDPYTGSKIFRGRCQKPWFKYLSTKGVVVEASEAKPAYFYIGGNVHTVTSNLECNLLSNGLGGFVTGVTLALGTVYYLYAVFSEKVYLVADLNSPSSGPYGYLNWTYLGAFATRTGSADVTHFRSMGGYHVTQDVIQAPTTTSTSFVSTTILNPSTAYACVCNLSISGTVIGAYASVVGFTDPVNYALDIYLTVSGQQNRSNLMTVPTNAYNTVYIKSSDVNNTCSLQIMGWVENPSEWQ